MRFLLTVRPWPLWIAMFGLPFALMGQFMAGFDIIPRWLAISAANGLVGFIYLAWLWSIGRGLQHPGCRQGKWASGLFTAGILFILVARYGVIFAPSEVIKPWRASLQAIALPLQIITGLSLAACIHFAAKVLVSAEIGRQAHHTEYRGTFYQLCGALLTLGQVQGRCNALSSTRARERNNDS